MVVNINWWRSSYKTGRGRDVRYSWSGDKRQRIRSVSRGPSGRLHCSRMERTSGKRIPPKHSHLRHGIDPSSSELMSGLHLIQKLLGLIIPLPCPRRRRRRLRPQSRHQQQRYPSKSRRRHKYLPTRHDNPRHLRPINPHLVQTTHPRNPPTPPRQPLCSPSLRLRVPEYLHVRRTKCIRLESTTSV